MLYPGRAIPVRASFPYFFWSLRGLRYEGVISLYVKIMGRTFSPDIFPIFCGYVQMFEVFNVSLPLEVLLLSGVLRFF